MVVLLQREPPARLDDDALDLMTVAIVDRLIGSPGPVHPDVILGHLRRHRLQLRDQPLQPVGVLLPGDQHGVLGRDHHEVVDAFERDQRAVGRYVAIAGILEHRSAPRRVALAVLAGQFPHRMPGADIGPAARDRHDRGARGLFHHRIIDRDRLRRSERGLVELDESEVGARLRHRIGHGLDAFRIDLAIFIRQYGGAEHEVAAVPEIAGLDIAQQPLPGPASRRTSRPRGPCRK